MVQTPEVPSKAVTESVDCLQEATAKRATLAAGVRNTTQPQIATLSDDQRQEAEGSRDGPLTGATAQWYRDGRSVNEVALLTVQRGQSA